MTLQLVVFILCWNYHDWVPIWCFLWQRPLDVVDIGFDGVSCSRLDLPKFTLCMHTYLLEHRQPTDGAFLVVVSAALRRGGGAQTVATSRRDELTPRVLFGGAAAEPHPTASGEAYK